MVPEVFIFGRFERTSCTLFGRFESHSDTSSGDDESCRIQSDVPTIRGSVLPTVNKKAASTNVQTIAHPCADAADMVIV